MAQISEENFFLNQETENFQGTVLGSNFRFKNYSNQPHASAHPLPPLFFRWLKNKIKKTKSKPAVTISTKPVSKSVSAHLWLLLQTKCMGLEWGGDLAAEDEAECPRAGFSLVTCPSKPISNYFRCKF